MAKEKPKYLTKALRCPDGTRKYIRGKTQAELDRKVREAQAQLGMGININDNTTVTEYAQIWVDVYKRPNVKPQTLSLILAHLNTHILPCIGGVRLRDLRTSDCAKVMACMSRAGLAKSTQSMVRSRLKEMLDCAVEDRMLLTNPVTKSVKASGYAPEEKVPLTSEQMDTLIQGAARLDDETVLTFILLCGYAGLRASEALGLNKRNIDLNRGTIQVVEQYRANYGGTTTELKTSASKRTVPAPPLLLAHLSNLALPRADGYLFDVRSPKTLDYYQREISKLCDVKSDGSVKARRRSNQQSIGAYVHPHLLRHTFCTRCFEAGMDIKEVQYLMGHTTPTLTLKTYTHYQTTTRLDETAEKLNHVFPTKVYAAM